MSWSFVAIQVLPEYFANHTHLPQSLLSNHKQLSIRSIFVSLQEINHGDHLILTSIGVIRRWLL